MLGSKPDCARGTVRNTGRIAIVFHPDRSVAHAGSFTRLMPRSYYANVAACHPRGGRAGGIRQARTPGTMVRRDVVVMREVIESI